MAGERIDIAINEQGASEVRRRMDELASALQALSPTAAASMRGKALRVGLSTDKVTKKVAKAILENVVYATPHDTGQARANWQVVISEMTPATSPLLGETDYDGGPTIAAGTSIIEGTNRVPGQTIWISNALDYIVPLDEGRSTQRAAGFVARAVQAGSRVAKQARLDVD